MDRNGVGCCLVQPMLTQAKGFNSPFPDGSASLRHVALLPQSLSRLGACPEFEVVGLHPFGLFFLLLSFEVGDKGWVHDVKDIAL